MSDPAVTDSDGDGLPDNWELAYFGTLVATPGGDPDGDGRTNLQEYQNGTNPAQAELRVLIAQPRSSSRLP